MAYRPLEVSLLSAKDLSNVNLFSKMEVYAVSMLAGDPRSKKKSPVDRDGGRNPNWNATMKFNVMEFELDRAVLHVLLRSERAMGDRDIGEVHVPIRELLDGWNRAAGGFSNPNGEEKKSSTAAQFLSYQVRQQSGKPKGVLNLSYKFGDLVTIPTPPPPHITVDAAAAYAGGPPTTCPPTAYAPLDAKGSTDPSRGHEPVTSYPAAGANSAYPPPQGGYAYPPAPQGGYAYPPPSQGWYGYPPPSQGWYGYPPPSQGGYGYPPPAGYPPQQPGYCYPPQEGGYCYPPQGYGYSAPPQVVQPKQGKKKSKRGGLGGAGLGLGAGLIGGAVGGMILGDVMSDVAEAAAFDAGFAVLDDVLGF